MVKTITIKVKNKKIGNNYILSSNNLNDYISSTKPKIDNFLSELNKTKKRGTIMSYFGFLFFLLAILLITLLILYGYAVYIAFSFILFCLCLSCCSQNDSREIKKKNNKVFNKYKNILGNFYSITDKTPSKKIWVGSKKNNNRRQITVWYYQDTIFNLEPRSNGSNIINVIHNHHHVTDNNFNFNNFVNQNLPNNRNQTNFKNTNANNLKDIPLPRINSNNINNTLYDNQNNNTFNINNGNNRNNPQIDNQLQNNNQKNNPLLINNQNNPQIDNQLQNNNQINYPLLINNQNNPKLIINYRIIIK